MNQIRVIILLLMFTFVVAQDKIELEKKSSLENKESNILPTKSTILDDKIDIETYLVGPGDVFQILIESVESLPLIATVTPAGNLTVPNIGRFEVYHKTLAKVIDDIHEKGKVEIRNANIYVDLVQPREFKIWVHGAVDLPGYYIASHVTRAYEIAQRATPKTIADLAHIEIKRNGQTISLNWINLIKNGDRNENPYLLEGDVLFLPHGSFAGSTVSLDGSILNPGYYVIEENETLLSFISRTAITDEKIDFSFIRINRNGESVEVKKSEFASFGLENNDEINLIHKEYVRVTGYVQTPGLFEYVPGYRAIDYINLAGGITSEGKGDKTNIIKKSGESAEGLRTIIEKGDIIDVPRSMTDIIFGRFNVVSIVTTATSLIVYYLSIGK